MVPNPKKRASSTAVNDSAVKKPKIDVIYLKDNTPVRTIKVGNLLKNTTSEYLRGYFECGSGPIDNVKIVRESSNDCEKMVAFVTFKIPEDAAKLISDTNLIFNNKFTVKEAPDIYQPKLDPNALKLDQINDDCLFHIISYLDLVDIVSLGQTCVRMKSLTKVTYKKFRHFTFDANTGDSLINELTLPKILKGIGPYIRSIEIHDLNAKILDTFGEHCSKINKIKMVNPARNLNSTSFKKNKSFFNMLKSLEIKNSGFFDTSLKLICHSNKLRSLTLDKCHHVRGKFLIKLNKLKMLKVFNCSMIENQHFYWCQKKNRLTKFATDICGCTFLHFFQHPVVDIKQDHDIEELELDFSMFHGDVSQLNNFSTLRNLKKFTVTRKIELLVPFPNLNNFLLTLAAINTLESLNIQDVVIEDDTLRHLSQIANLKHLRLSISNNTIGNSLYKNLHQHLPNLTELALQMLDTNQSNYESISKMITALQNLKFFYHSSTTLPLLKIIQEELHRVRRLYSVKIGINSIIENNDPQMKEFIACSEMMIVKEL